ncbi:F-box/kelch-repeat protein At3g06240-like [Actinidia eriantha]|uniref:F-box/kelch-repeat protein At3g06240-like n=1 Tax=Actinidia eriantha TaxID=165200 RepID=UPI00258E4D24|nr:F-box/kelch-repeat protein At3g06240-like [Actinidia eriantha]
MANYVEDHCHHSHHYQHDMPEDVLIEILKRLPVKSLLRFKCICKYWYALVLNPTFVNHHLNFQKGNNQGRLLLQHYNSHSYQYGYALFPDKILTTTSYHNLDYLHGEIVPVYIDGPINGLFCLNFEDRFIIWNPAMKEFRSLPFPHHPKIPLHFSLDWHSFGFGFDPITKDYKVVFRQQFINEITLSSPEKDVIVDVYTLSTNTWRHLDGIDYVSSEYLTSHHGNGAYLDGIYYWPAVGRVLAFDVGNEIFRAILGPDTPMHYTLLTLYNDHIALCGFKDFPESEIDRWIEFWVMEAEASWIKQFCIEALPRIEQLLGFWNNSEFLFVVSNSLKKHGYDNSQVVLYDFTTQNLEILDLKELITYLKLGLTMKA